MMITLHASLRDFAGIFPEYSDDRTFARKGAKMWALQKCL